MLLKTGLHLRHSLVSHNLLILGLKVEVMSLH